MTGAQLFGQLAQIKALEQVSEVHERKAVVLYLLNQIATRGTMVRADRLLLELADEIDKGEHLEGGSR